jgi:spermidine synthase
MIILNLLLGLYFLVTGGAPSPAASAAAPIREVVSNGTHDAGVGSNNLGALLLFAGLSGLLSGALEGDMFKRIGFLLGPVPGATMSFISFWAILAIFLGSSAVRVLPRLKLFGIKGAFLLAFAYYVGIWALRDEVIVNYLPINLFGLLKFTGMFVFPPYLLISLLLPWVCNHIQAERRHLGIAYGLNTVAFCAGLLAFTAVAPRVNIFYSTKLFILLFAVATLMLMLLSNQRRVSWFVVAGASAALILGVVLIPHTFDRSYFRPGSDPSRKIIRALRSNGAHTTYVVESGDTNYRLSLFFGSHSMSDTGLVAQTYMRLMAHLPLLSQDNPQRALLICYGVGNTASAIAAHSSIRQIDVVDLNYSVFQTAPEFALTNNDVHRDPRLRMINDDGRGFLRLTDEKYDLITSEPPPPMVEGVYRLYSHEYYEAALARLTQDGIMTQWLPTSSLSQEGTDLIVSTFLDIFPYTLLFRGWEYRGNRGSELLLAGSHKPIDTDKIIRNFHRDQAVVDDLAKVGVRSGMDIVLRIQANEKQLAKSYANVGILSDQHNDLEHSLINPTLPRPTVRW